MELDPTAKLPIKVVTVGDHLVGKSCAITTFVTSQTPLIRQSTVFDSSNCEISINGVDHSLSIWDTTGNKVYGGLIQSCYKDAEIFLIFFSVIDTSSFRSALEKWYPQVTSANSKALVFFVGNKIDQRVAASTGEQVSKSEATKKIVEELKQGYVECSAFTKDGLHEVFETSVRGLLRSKGMDVKGNKGKKVGGGSSGSGGGRKKGNETTCCLMM